MLSLPKTKNLDEIKNFIGDKDTIAMCKMDGLTCSLRYANGKLVSAETRGNGEIGENILHNALHIPSIPRYIQYSEELIIDGEIICTYKDFENFADTYKNPRNFASGSIRLLDSREAESRHLTFVVWEIIKGFSDDDSLSSCFSKIKDLHFITVPFIKENNCEEDVNTIKKIAEEYSYPIDGLVFKYDSRSYVRSLTGTAHHLGGAMAFKFYDEESESKLINIEWTMGRTGVLTPVAIFEPVEMDGSIVERASLHNISIMRELFGTPHKGDIVHVIKSNQIIPQIISVDNDGTEELTIPEVCPICHRSTVVMKSDGGTLNLVCGNSDCEGKLINKLDHFCGKKGLDIKGLSKATLEKLLNWGWLNNIIDIYNLDLHKSEWISKAGFGTASVTKLLKAIEDSKNCDLDRFICAIGIPLIGSTASKSLANEFGSWDNFINAVHSNFKFYNLPDFGPESSAEISKFNYDTAIELANNVMTIAVKEKQESSSTLEGKTFVITGSLNHYKNRDELKSVIESNGGKVSGSISAKTSYLINNDVESTSSKNQSAKKLGIPIISEEEFLKLI